MFKDDDDDTCQLLGPVSLLIQCIMGLAAIGALLVKRNYEHPQRTWNVWFYDIGKQVLGSLGIHFMNLFISILQDHHPRILGLDPESGNSGDDQCDWYFLNLLMDTTVGIPILWVFLNGLEKILKALHLKNIESGNYFAEPDEDDIGESCATSTQRFSHTNRTPLASAFAKQLLVFMTGLAMMKFTIFLILVYFEAFANWFADLVLGWSDPWPNFQVFLVMFVFPVLLNCFQYFCVDNIIKLHPDHLTATNAENFEHGSLIEERMQRSDCTKNTYNSI